MKTFASDNYSPVSPEIFEYLKKININHARSYGHDEYTEKAKKIIQYITGISDAVVHFVLTGTAANVLSIKQCLRSTESLLVPQTGHINVNEAGASEAFTQNKLIQIPTVDGKINVEVAEKILLQELDNIPHAPRPKMLTIAQSTEYGTIYTIEELKKISQFCKKYNLLLHMDLCRVYNAAVALNVEIKEIISIVNPDIVSLGGTKNGLMFAEAIVIFNKKYQNDFEILQKQGMQLYSKMRYLSAQFIPFFEQGIWKRNAKLANDSCHYLYEQIKKVNGIEITHPCETNHLFLKLPKEIIKPLQEITPFYVWDIYTDEVRLVTSFDTKKEEIDIFINKLKALLLK
ncbi:MAG: aminotransferase class I/II-fold pyridoxal phosphate-dependent enzyme [bacterium]|nr:aminotransferase class I/II-fold pyridoxal phosphate-dependent enzyme [bacterium]